MQKLRKREIKRYVISAILFSCYGFLFMWAILFLSACAGVPPAPEGKIHTIDYPRRELTCATVGRGSENCPRIPLPQADKYVCFQPDYFGEILDYIDELRRLAKERCQ